MKKITSLLLAVSLAATLGVCLTACGETTDTPPSDSENSAPSNPSDSGNPNPSGPSQTTYTVTPTEWDSAFSGVNNYTCSQVLTGSNLTYGYKYTSDSFYLDGTEKQIITKSGEEYYAYTWDSQSSKWGRTSFGQSDYTQLMSTYKMLVSSFSGASGSFSYSETTHEYTCASMELTNLGMTATDITVKFENAVLVSLVYTTSGMGSSRVCTFTDFGSTVIEVPSAT